MIYAWGAVPLTLGVFFFALWFLTRGIGVALLGLLVILLGLAASLGFAVHLGLALRRRKKQNSRPRRKTIVLATLLMLVNYPVAAAFVYTYDFLCTRAYLRVSNRSGAPLEEVIVRGPGGERNLGGIGDGATRRAFFRPAESTSGPLSLTVVQGKTRSRLVLTGYLDTAAGRAAWAITVNPGPSQESRRIFRAGE